MHFVRVDDSHRGQRRGPDDSFLFLRLSCRIRSDRLHQFSGLFSRTDRASVCHPGCVHLQSLHNVYRRLHGFSKDRTENGMTLMLCESDSRVTHGNYDPWACFRKELAENSSAISRELFRTPWTRVRRSGLGHIREFRDSRISFILSSLGLGHYKAGSRMVGISYHSLIVIQVLYFTCICCVELCLEVIS